MSNFLARFIKPFLPKKLIIILQDLRYSKFSKIPTEQLFAGIYEKKFWGDGTSEFYSGVGSDNTITKDYVQSVVNFIIQNDIKSITDIGCGDFRVGKAILERLPDNLKPKYIGVDIVEGLIKHNQKTHIYENVDFKQLNAIKDTLPLSDMCTIRQVLQHLNNEQIISILNKVKGFKYALITEEQPFDQTDVTPNIDKTQGPHVRTVYNSGIYLEKSPFDLSVTILLESEINSEDRFGRPIKTLLKTYLLKHEG